MSDKLIPKLRFPKFTDEWVTCKLNEVSEEIKRKKENISLNDNILTISANKGFINQKDKWDDVIAGKSLKNYTHLKKDEFSYNRGNSKSFKYGCIYRLEYEDGLVPYVYHSFKITKGIPLYFEQLFKSKVLDKQLVKMITSTARMDGLLNITAKNFFNININISNDFEEQKMIGNFLHKIDNKINLLEKYHENYINFKKGLLDDIFSDKLRVGNKTEDWKTIKLGDICDIKTGKLDANAMVKNGKYRFYTCAKEHYFIDEYAYDTEALLISGNGAHVGYIHYYKGKFNAYQRTYILDNFKEDIKFIMFALEKYLKKRIQREKNEGSTPYIKLSTLKNMKINIPTSKTEQKQIASIFINVNNKINCISDELENMHKFKKGLLQQMFI